MRYVKFIVLIYEYNSRDWEAHVDTDKEAEGIEREMDETVRAMRALGPCLEGSMKMNAKARYVKKDGTVSEYPTAPILQYRAGPKVRRYRRVPRDKIDEILRRLTINYLESHPHAPLMTFNPCFSMPDLS